MMRVLMICPELPRSDRPGSMAPTARQIASIRELGVEVDVVDMRGIPKLKYLQALPKIRRLAKQVDRIHAHFGYCGWLAKFATLGMRQRPPLVMSFMGDDLLGSPMNAAGDLEWFSRLMVRANIRLAPRCDRVIVKSAEMARVIAPTPCTVIPNGVDVDAFKPICRDVAREQLGWNAAGRYVLFPGDPNNPRKGYQLATEAVEVAQRDSEIQIQLVPLWGVAPGQVAIYMNACDAMLMTSLIEGSPNVVKEAMACDLPVIGVPVGDVEEMLTDVNGCAFCQRDPDEIGNRLATLMKAEHVAGRDAITGRGLDLASVARRVMQIYESVGQTESLRFPETPRESAPERSEPLRQT